MTRCWVCNEEFGVDGSHICADTPFRIKAQQQPQLLTDDEMRACADAMDAEPLADGWKELSKFARSIEQAVLKKNGVI